MTTWQNYLLVRKNESIIKSSIPQLLEMGIDPIGFYRDVLSGQDANKAMELNEMPVAPQQGQQAMTPQQMSTVLANMIAQDKNSQVKDPNVTKSFRCKNGKNATTSSNAITTTKNSTTSTTSTTGSTTTGSKSSSNA
jgi:hypothetical protein